MATSTNSATVCKSPIRKHLENSFPVPDNCCKQHTSQYLEHLGCKAQSSCLAWPGWPRDWVGAGPPSAHRRLPPSPEPSGCSLAPCCDLRKSLNLGGHPSVLEALPVPAGRVARNGPNRAPNPGTRHSQKWVSAREVRAGGGSAWPWGSRNVPQHGGGGGLISQCLALGWSYAGFMDGH